MLFTELFSTIHMRLVIYSAFSLLVCLAVVFLAARRELTVDVTLRSPVAGAIQLFWDSGEGFSEAQSSITELKAGAHTYTLAVPWTAQAVRLDPCSCTDTMTVQKIRARSFFTVKSWDGATPAFESWKAVNNVKPITNSTEGAVLIPTGNDPFIVNATWQAEIKEGVCVTLLIIFLLTLVAIHLLVVVLGRLLVATPQRLLGPVVAIMSFFVFGTIAAVAYLGFRAVPGLAKSAVFRGTDNAYGVSLVSVDGQPLSEPHGALKLALNPFTLYRTLPQQQTAQYSIDELGFRGSFDSLAPNKIFLLGGSTAFGQGLGQDSECVNARIEARMPQYQITNAGVVGFLSGQELSLIVHTLSDFHPKAYVIFDGWNEIFEQLTAYKRTPGYFGVNSNMYLVQQRLKKLFKLEHSDLGTIIEDDPIQPFQPDDAYLSQITQTYISNLLKMRTFVAGTGAKLLVVFQPELSKKLYKTEPEEEILAAWNQQFGYLSKGYHEHYAAMVNEAQGTLEKNNVTFVNLLNAQPFIEDKRQLFLDAVHLNAQGHELAAELIAEKLKELMKP